MSEREVYCNKNLDRADKPSVCEESKNHKKVEERMMINVSLSPERMPMPIQELT